MIPMSASAADCAIIESTSTFNSVQYKYVAIKTGSSCTYTIPSGASSIDILAVGGGGGGSSRHGGGGSAGQFQEITGRSVAPGTTLTITIGSGGAGGSASVMGQWGQDGTATTISGNNSFSTITSTGGSGGRWTQDSNSRGTSGNGFFSGLGGGGWSCNGSTSGWCGGGGAGSTSDGQNADAGNNNRAGNGGSGSSPSFFDSTIASSLTVPSSFSGGGGGGADLGGAAGNGVNGGGNGSVGPSNAPGSGLANSGGGGGGSGYENSGGQQSGGAGGSGLVVLRFIPLPGAPTITNVVSTATQATLTWSAPTDTGGGTISNYSFEYSTDNGATWTPFTRTASTSTTQVITGLTNSGLGGARNQYRIRTITNFGSSSASTAVNGWYANCDTEPSPGIDDRDRLNEAVSLSTFVTFAGCSIFNTSSNMSLTSSSTYLFDPSASATGSISIYDAGFWGFQWTLRGQGAQTLVPKFSISESAESATVSITNFDASFGWSVSADGCTATRNAATISVSNYTKRSCNIQVTTTKSGWATGQANAYTGASRHAVSYKTLSGTGTMADQTSGSGATVTISANSFTRAGFTFNGWNTLSNGTGTSYAVGSSFTLTSSLTLWAQWTGNSLTVTWNAKGGSSVSNTTVATGATLSAPTPPTRAGYTFAGWSATDGGTAVTFPYTHGQTANFTMYAIWTADTNNVIYDEKGGSTVTDGTFLTGGTVTFPSNPTRAGFIFGGWSATDGGNPVSAPYSPSDTSNITLYAVWLAISPPAGVTATAGNQSVTVAWTAPANSASQPPTAYRVEYSTTGTGSWTTADATISSSARTYQITGLTNSTAYYVRVAAVYAGVTGAYGYPWTLIFESTTPSRTVVYSSTNGLSDNDIDLSRSDFSRVRYYVGAKYASGDATRLFVDANFDKTISNSASGGDSYTNLFRLQVPRPSGGTNSQFELHGNVSDLIVVTNSANVTQGVGLSGRLEIWPWDYGIAPQSGLSGGTNSASLYDDGDSWTVGQGDYGSFQLHNIGSTVQTIFAWNRHYDTVRPDIGFGNNTSGTNPDWTFARDQAGYTTRADFLFQSYANLSVTPVATYTITLNRGANGTGTDQTLTKTHGQSLTLPDSATANSYFTRAGYTVGGWSTTDGGSQTHAFGGSFTTEAATTLYPVWTGNTYTVTYQYNSADGGTRPATSSFTVGGSAITLPTPTRTGYIFDGWFAEVGLATSIGAAGASYSPSSNTTIYAKWIPNTYTITYAAGSSATGSNQTQTKTHAVDLTLPNSATANGWFARSGQTIVGWSTTDGGNLAHALGGTFTTNSATTLYPVWTCAAGNDPVVSSGLVLRLDADNACSTGTAGKWRDISGNSRDMSWVNAPTLGTDYGKYYEFVRSSSHYGTLTSSGLSDFTGGFSITFWARFDATGGGGWERILDIGRGDSNENIIVGREGNTNRLIIEFRRGSTETLECSSAIITDGQWAHFSITVNSSGNCVIYKNGTSQTLAVGVTRANPFLPNNIERTSNFIGDSNWAADAFFDGGIGDLALYNRALTSSEVSTNYSSQLATPATYTITLNKGTSGTGSNQTLTKTHGQALTLPDSATANSYFTRSGYSVTGWTTSDGGSQTHALGGSFTTEAATTLYPVWTGNTYTITYSSNGGSSASNGSFTVGGSGLTLPTVTRTGYTFAGWYEASDFSGSQLSSPYSPSQTRTVYAKWTANTYNVTYDEKGGSTVLDGTFITGGAVSFPTSPTRTGYTFGGWSATNGGVAVSTPYSPGVTSNITLYAVWTSTLAITTPSSGLSGTVGQAYTLSISTTGGSGTNSFSATGTLPSGLTINSSTGVISGTPSAAGDSSITVTVTDSSSSSKTTNSFTISIGHAACVPQTDTSSSPGFTILKFTTVGNCNWEVPALASSASVLVVAGGGGGAFGNNAGGGGAGEVLVTGSATLSAGTVSNISSISLTPGAVITIGIGSGGTSGAPTGSTATDAASYWNCCQGTSRPGGTGGNSSFGTIIAKGGGGGGGGAGDVVRVNGENGGSGGGGASGGTGGLAQSLNTYSGWTSFKNSGAAGATGGGGGAGSAGTTQTRQGGAGVSVLGITVAGGGGGWGGRGGADSLTDQALGGNGRLTTDNWRYAGTAPNYTSAGVANTGTGGGAGAPGGSGIVVVRYQSAYVVTFNYNSATGGNTAASDTFQIGGTALTLPTPSRTGYTFAGWYEASDFSGSALGNTYSPTQTRTIYAKWTVLQSTITFNANDGTGSPATSTQSVNNGVATALTSNSFTRTGYTFAGWNTLANGTGTNYTNQQSVTLSGNLTLYAKWTANTYTVTYTYNGADGGTRPTTDSFTVGGSAITLPTPSRLGFVFGGWYAEVGLSTLIGAAGASYSPTADATIYARWTNTLIVDLDATNLSSYSGTGTTWTNIAPGASPASATLDSAAMYSSQFGGVMNTNSNRKATTESKSLTLDNSVGYTMEVWVRFNAVNTAQGVASYDGNSKYINFYKPSNAGMRWEVSGSNAITDTTVVAANTWYHFVGTCKNNTAVLYRNGVQAISSTGRTCTTSQNSAFLVGNIQGIQMDGSVSLFRFYTSALTADEVLTRYNATKSRTTFTVTYNYDSADGGNSTASATYANGDSAIVLPTPTKTNNTFAGWYSDAGKTLLVGNAGSNYTPSGANSAITLYAKWTGNTSTVTFNANDGSGSPATSTQSISNGVATALTANAFTRTGYTFAGWNSLANGTGTNYTNQQSVTLTGNLTLYAKWTANTYTVTYTYNNADGGTRPATDSFTVGGAAVTLPTPTHTGYTFAGWYGEIGLSTLIGNAGASYSPTANVTIYAKWTANNNTVTFKSNYVGGANDSTQTIVTAVATGLTSNSFTRAGYVFVGWNTLANGTGTNYTDGQSVTITGALTLYAKWTAGTYTVTYNYNSATGGASVASGSFTTGGANLVLPVPTKTGYTFAGWYDDSGFTGSALASSITTTSSKTIYAKWTAATFTVLYEYNAATAGDSTASNTYTTGSTTITLPTPTKTGYTFAGWYEASNFSGSAVSTPYTTSQNRSLYAKWNAISYTVTYNANLVVGGNTISGSGSVPVNNNNYNIGQSFSVAANTGPLTRSGYTFAGWVTNEDGTGTAKNSGETITFGAANINLYPKWTANTYTIAYNLNGGSGDLTSAPTSWTVGNANVTLPSSGFTRTGYNFAGWSKTQGGSVINNSFNNIGNVTLYASWTLKTISYTFDKGTAAGQSIPSWPSNSSATFGTTITLPTPSNTVTINSVSYQFFGWEYSGTTYQPGSTFTLSETAPTFVAQWVRLYDVRYAYAGGTHSVAGDTDDECVTASLCLQDQDITLRTAPVRPGYNFIGWRVQDTNTTKSAGALHRVIATGYLFYANWQAIDYDFSFNSSGGSDSHSSVTANVGQLVTMPNPGFRVGYTFAGWSPDNGTTKYTTGSTFTVGTASQAFVAYWTPNVYTVVYDWQGASGTPTPDASYTVGTGSLTLPLIGDRTKDGYTFGGWSETPGGTAVSNFTPTANDVLYAIWNDGNYTLSYDGRGASSGSGQGSVNRGSSVTLPTPVRAGFVFTGWYDDATAGNKIGNGGASHTPGRSRTLYARWVQRSLYGVDPATLESGQEYTASDTTGVDTNITHNPTSTSARIQIPSGALPNGTKVNVQYFRDTDRQSNLIPGNNSYFFSVLVSWLSGSGTSATVPNTNAGKPITVTLNNPSIKAGAMVYMVIGDQVTELGRATQDGTVTVELTQDPEIVVAATAPGNPASVVASSGDQEATVSWAAPSTNGGAQIVSYTVTASPGNASCTTATTTCTVTGLTNGTAYTFSVVATNSVGSSTGASSASITPALATYTVTFNSNGGGNVSNGTFTSGGSVSEPSAPTRSGYTFDGWSTVLNRVASKVTFPYSPGVNNNITLYALWTQVQSSGGSGGSNTSPTVTPTPTPPVTPGPTAPPSQIGFKPTPPPTPVAETGPVGSIVGSSEKVTVVADAPSEKIIATAGSWKLEIKPPVTEEAEKPVTEKLELQLPVASKAEISGTGLQPNTTVEAWVFSTPRYLGTLKVGADGSFASSLALPKDLLPGQHTLQIGSLNEQGRLVTISIPISIKGSVTVGTFRGFVAIFTKDLEGQELTAKVAGKWIKQNPVRKFKNFGYSRLTRLTGAGYDIVIDVYINKKFYKRFKTRTR